MCPSIRLALPHSLSRSLVRPSFRWFVRALLRLILSLGSMSSHSDTYNPPQHSASSSSTATLTVAVAADRSPATSSSITSSTPTRRTLTPTPTPASLTLTDRLASVDDYSALDTLTKPVLPRVQSASRYRRIDGEPTLAFFRRERNSLSAYCRPSSTASSADTVSGSGSGSAGEDEWDEAMNRLEKRAVMSGAVRDDTARGGYLGNDRRYEVRNQRVQREKRQSLKQMRAARLMQTLKFLLTMKGK